MPRELKETSSAEVSLILRLLEVGNVDTLYRDLYLERAHALMGDLLPHSEYLRLKYSKVNIDDLLRQVAPVLERQDWVKVKELTGRIRILRAGFRGETHSCGGGRQNLRADRRSV